MRSSLAKQKNGSGRRIRARTRISLLATTALVGASLLDAAPVDAQTTGQSTNLRYEFNIPHQSLSSAVIAFSRITGTSVIADGAVPKGAVSAGVTGAYSPDVALRQILSGTGLTYSMHGNTVRIIDPNASSAGGAVVDGEAIQLEAIDVTTLGNGGARPEDIPYETAGSVNYISEEQIDRYRGTSPSDILKNAPGVYSGESRASGGLDVNIRGMQGQGRVPVTVDGAQNSTALYRGYQGISNSTFIDPDFIGGISIEKGPSMGAAGTGAIGGLVSMRTLNADDIIPEGESFGSRIKLQAGTNTESPWESVGKKSIMGNPSVNPPLEYNWKYPTDNVTRPDLLELNSGSASVVMASRSENIDLVGGFSRRKSGNYHAGENGGAAPKTVACDDAAERPCSFDWYRTGLTAYLPGEEVLNTSQDIYSSLLKATLRFGDDHTLDLGYSHYNSEYGEQYPFGLWNNIQDAYQTLPSRIDVDSYTSRYRWNPVSDLIDVRWNVWATSLEEETAATGTKVLKEARMRGTDLSNTSLFDTSFGAFSLQYGVSYLYEETAPTGVRGIGMAPREGNRNEASIFSNAGWQPLDWLKLDAGLRYHRYESENDVPGNTDPVREDDALDYMAGVTVMPVDGIQVYGTYRDASRLPSLFESTGGFATVIDGNIRPEHAKTWEAGVNFNMQAVVAEEDSLKFKIGYFDSEIDDYINRTRRRICNVPGGCTYSWQYTDEMFISNIEQANFAGIDLTARYEWEGFSAELMASYFTDVEFCRTLANCKNSSLAADYATNHVPPEYSASLTLTQKLFDDRLTLSGRVSHTGPRAAEAEPVGGGASPFIAQIPWKPYTLVDLSTSYKLNDVATLNLSVENLMDIYYVDPLSLALMPSPGRTIRLGVTGEFSSSTLAALAGTEMAMAEGEKSYDWTGLYAGLHGGAGTSSVRAEDFTLFSTVQDHMLQDVNGAFGGVQLGYNHHLSNNFVLGVEGEFTWSNAEKFSFIDPYDEQAIETEFNWLASARGRVGYAVDKFLIYGTAGYTRASLNGTSGYEAWVSQGQYEWRETTDRGARYSGWTVGGGVEYALSDNLTIKGEYTFTNLANGRFKPDILDERDSSWEARPKLDQLKVGVNYRF